MFVLFSTEREASPSKTGTFAIKFKIIAFIIKPRFQLPMSKKSKIGGTQIFTVGLAFSNSPFRFKLDFINKNLGRTVVRHIATVRTSTASPNNSLDSGDGGIRGQ